MDLLRENRLALWTGWGIAIAAVAGMDLLRREEFAWRRSFWLATLPPLVLGIWCIVRIGSCPDDLQEMLVAMDTPTAEAVSAWFVHTSTTNAVLCGGAVILWLAIAGGMYRRRWFFGVLGCLAVGEAIVMAYNAFPQGDPRLYYPDQPLLKSLAVGGEDRVCGVSCLPACLTETYGLLDVRGYDAVDPARLVDLLQTTQPGLLLSTSSGLGALQLYAPLRFPTPITRMIDLQYLIFSGDPPLGQRPRFHSDGYYAIEDAGALPRAFVPRHIEVEDDNNRRLELLSRPDFDPREVAYVESPGNAISQDVRGNASIVRELPSHVTIRYSMETPGVVVLSDLWDKGWHARVNGIETPVLRANHAFRGVPVPAGEGIIQYDYEPASIYGGIKIAMAAGTILLLWSGVVMVSRRVSRSA